MPRAVEAGGEDEAIGLQILHLPPDTEVADALLVQEAKGDGEVGAAPGGGGDIHDDVAPGVGAAGDIFLPGDGPVDEQLLEMIAGGSRRETVPLAEAETLALARPDGG